MSVALFLIVVGLARLGAFAVPLGLFLRATYDPDVAQLFVVLAGGMTLGTASGLWPSGRILDRVGPWRGLRVWLCLGGISLAALAVGLRVDLRPTALVVLGFAAGVGLAPAVPAPRALLPVLVEPAGLVRASGVDAVSVEVALLTAPLLAAGLAAHGRSAIVAVPAVLVLLAAAALREGPARRHQRRPADSDSLRRCLGLAGLAALVGLSGGSLEPALARSTGTLIDGVANGAVLLTAVGIGSVVGGAVGAYRRRAPAGRHGAWLLYVHAAGLLAAAGTESWWQVLSLLLAGAPLAPLMSAGALWIDSHVHQRGAGEALAAVTTALTAATGAGQLVAAPLLDVAGPRPVIAFAAVPVVVAGSILGVKTTSSHRGRGMAG